MTPTPFDPPPRGDFERLVSQLVADSAAQLERARAQPPRPPALPQAQARRGDSGDTRRTATSQGKKTQGKKNQNHTRPARAGSSSRRPQSASLLMRLVWFVLRLPVVRTYLAMVTVFVPILLLIALFSDAPDWVVTVVIMLAVFLIGNPNHRQRLLHGWRRWRRYINQT